VKTKVKTLNDKKSLYYNWSSEIYGLGQYYRAIAKYPSRLPLFFTSDHGCSFPDDTPNYARESNPRSLFHLTWSPWIKASKGDWSKGPMRIAIKHPYFLKELPRYAKEKEVVTYFPYHTVPGHQISGLDDKRNLNLLHEIVCKGAEVRVCLHWHDWNTDRRIVFSKILKTITAGDSLCADFATNLLEILQESQEIVSENVGSQVFYALALGKKITFLCSEIQASDSLLTNQKIRQLEKSLISRIKNFQNNNSDEMRGEILRDFLGFDYKWSRVKIFLICWISLVAIGPRWFCVRAFQKFRERMG